MRDDAPRRHERDDELRRQRFYRSHGLSRSGREGVRGGEWGGGGRGSGEGGELGKGGGGGQGSGEETASISALARHAQVCQ